MKSKSEKTMFEVIRMMMEQSRKLSERREVRLRTAQNLLEAARVLSGREAA